MSDIFPSAAYLREEITALEEEGFDVSEPAGRLHALADPGSAGARAKIEGIAVLLGDLPQRPDFHYREPSDLDGIRAARPDGPRALGQRLAQADLDDKTLGAWLGRAAACLLGKPCEGWSRERIERALRALDAWPLADYWPVVHDLPEGFVHRSRTEAEAGKIAYPAPDDSSLRENITRMTRDDDMDYPILGLHVLETHGPAFTTADVGNAWLHLLPYGCVYTAERMAYRNLVNELKPPATAIFCNPYREWIGAQIRADIFGWACPGNPERAAELAWRDASLSHTKNGIYGEMFFAALLAAAFVESDLRRLIEIGLSEIPDNCRLSEAVLDTVEWCDRDPDWQATWKHINEKYGHYHGVHTINNAAVVLMGLLHGGGDYDRAITIAVMGGWDTDCNGATAGSVMGAILGAKALPGKWVAPLNDRISSIVIGYTDTRLSDLARRTGVVQKRIARAS
jgi:ADP-ribosylglycohydrolase